MKLKSRKICMLIITVLAVCLAAGVTTVPAQAATKKAKVKVGKTITKGNYKYKVTYVKGKKGNVNIIGAKKKTVTSVSIPKTIKESGYTLTVTGVANNAFKNYKKLKTVKTNTELTTIGKNAFAGDSKLTKITVSSKKVKSVGSNALKGINKKAVIQVPVGSTTTYAKILDNKGEAASVKILLTNGKAVPSPAPVVQAAAPAPAVKAAAPAAPAVPAHTHSFGAWMTTVEPTCTSVGTQIARCSCGATQARAIPALGHEFSAYVYDNNETCTWNGTETATCVRCGYKMSRTKAGTALGHSMGAWTQTQAPTCKDYGMEERSCETCGRRETRTLNKTTEHTWGAWVVTRETSCAYPGAQSRTCSVCGKKESEFIPSPSHTLVVDEEIKATCEARGKRYSHCSVCGYESILLTDMPLGHEYGDYTIDVPATCTTDGSKSRHCIHDGCTKAIDKEVIPSKGGHKWDHEEFIEEVAPTCDTAGIAARTCTECGEKETQPIRALGHQFDTNYMVDAAPTCTADGVQTKHCLRDGCKATKDSQNIRKLGHTFGPTTMLVVPTCLQDGKARHECTVCHHVETYTIPSEGHHTWEEISRVENECRGAVIQKRCTTCNTEEIERLVNAGTGHKWSSDNFETAVCEKCHEHAPSWTNKWADEVYTPVINELLKQYPNLSYNELVRDHGKEIREAIEAKGSTYRSRVGWYVMYKADTGMSSGFDGQSEKYDVMITADHIFVQEAPAARDGYKFIGWYEGNELRESGTLLKTTWRDMDKVIEARYAPVVEEIAAAPTAEAIPAE